MLFWKSAGESFLYACEETEAQNWNKHVLWSTSDAEINKH